MRPVVCGDLYGNKFEMTKRQTAENLKLLDQRLSREDEDRWLSSRYAPVVVRQNLIALYAFNLELAKVRTIVSEPGLGAIRFQWWRDAIEELTAGHSPRKHDVVQVLAEARLPEKMCLGLIDGHEAAFEAKDRGLEPEGLLMRAAASMLVSAHAWGTYIEEIAPARTYLLKEEADWMREQGLGLRVTHKDLLVFADPDGVIDNELRFEEECVRHKVLDMIGDLALSGFDLIGNFVAYRSGHRLNAMLVKAIMTEGKVIDASRSMA